MYLNRGTAITHEIYRFFHPMTTAMTRTICPAIENMARFWTDWDESLDAEQCIHFAAVALAPPLLDSMAFRRNPNGADAKPIAATSTVLDVTQLIHCTSKNGGAPN